MKEELCVHLVPLFNQLSLERQRQVEQLVHHQRIKRGTIVVSPDMDDRLVIVKSGHGRMYQLSEDCEERVQRMLKTGDYVGETWLLGVANHSSYVEMTTDSDICILNRQDFIQLIHHQSEIALKLMAGQAAMIESLRQQTRLMGLPNIEERVVTYLKQLMVDQQSSKVKLPLKLKDLSSYLGTTPETLSRTLAQLEADSKLTRHLRTIQIIHL